MQEKLLYFQINNKIYLHISKKNRTFAPKFKYRVMKKVILVLLTLGIMVSGYGRTKVKHGSFEILENERYCGLTMDFSKAKFDGRSLETQLRSEDMSAEEWKAI